MYNEYCWVILNNQSLLALIPGMSDKPKHPWPLVGQFFLAEKAGNTFKVLSLRFYPGYPHAHSRIQNYGPDIILPLELPVEKQLFYLRIHKVPKEQVTRLTS